MACSPLASALLQADGFAMPQFTLSLAQAHYRERKISLQRRAGGLINVWLQSTCKSPRKMVDVGAKCKVFWKH